MTGRLEPMLDPAQLFTVDEKVATSLTGTTPILLHQLHGFVDAGQAGRMLAGHMLDTLEHEPLAVFDHDQLHDYRSRRPLMVFDANSWKSVEDVALVLHAVRTDDGGSFLLLSGPEPDAQWDRYCAAVIMLTDRFEVTLSMSAYGIPMAVPHTRPLTMTAHATDPDLVNNYRSWIDRVEVPGSAVNMLQYRLGQAGKRAMGFAVHVPHYLAQSSFAPGALELAKAIEHAGGPRVELAALERSAEETIAEITKEMSSSTEVIELVGNLERAYDSMSTDSEGRMPSPDELGAEFERYLAERDEPDEGPTRPWRED